ncbi:MAG TPA: hypothetical protein VGP92_03535 [Acidimicrobiia bacterium]|nr:hypothetical protein [Acidimicrobiia bacterium]
MGDEHVVAWTQCWVSRDVPLHGVLAARTLDFAVVTDESLVLIATGFFTRRARARVFQSSLDTMIVASDRVPRGRRLRIAPPGARTLWLELGRRDRDTAFVTALLERARTGRL